jgi:hypothetical protein
MALLGNNGQNPKGEQRPIPVSGAVMNTPTSTPLAANASFTTGWFDARGYISLFYVMFSDVVGTLMVEYSNSATGANILASPVMVQYDSSFVARGIPRTGSFPPRADYVRLTYTNGTTPQASFNFLANLLTTQAQSSLETMLDQLTDTRLASVTKTVLQAKDAPAGAYDFIYRVNNALLVNVANFPAQNPTDVSALAKDSTLISGSQKSQISNAAGLAYGTQSNPFSVQLPATQNTALSNIDVDLGAPTDTAVLDPSAAAGLIALTKGLLTKLNGTLTTATNQTTTGGYPSKGVYQPSGTGGGFTLIATGIRKLGGITITNNNSNAISVMLYDKATVPTSSDTAAQSYVIPANNTLCVAMGSGMQFNNGLGIGAVVGTSLLNLVGSLITSISAGSITVNYWYI